MRLQHDAPRPTARYLTPDRHPRPAGPRSSACARSPGAAGPPARRGRALLALACFGLAALSLLGPATPTYDPWAWILWGREVMQLDLVTTDGPSWKPLPIFFTAPFALLGDDAGAGAVDPRRPGRRAPGDRDGFRLAARLAGPAAGAIAAFTLLVSDEFIRNFARGNSEGMLVALVLWALELHLDGRRRAAFLSARRRLAAPRGVAVPGPVRAVAGARRVARRIRGARGLVGGAAC